MTAGSLVVRIAQPDGAPDSHDDALAMVGRLLVDCDGVDLLVLPELALCGYGDANRIRRLAVELDASFIHVLTALVNERGTGLIAGMAIGEGARLYNCAVAILPGGGPPVIYRKLKLWGEYENGLFTSGSPSPVFELNGFRLGMLICHDLDHAETAIDLVDRGTDVIIVLSATSHLYRIVAESVVPARAYEAVSYVVYADACGRDGPFNFLGHSRIVAPNGDVLAKLADDRPATVDTALSLETVKEWRKRHPYRTVP